VWGFLGWNDREVPEPNPGEILPLSMMPEHVHLFDADNGARLIG
jgi:hypothetical protein